LLERPATDFLKIKKSYKSSVFAQYSWHPIDWLTASGGLRYDGFAYSGRHTLSPRFSLQFLPHSLYSVGLAWGVYRQALPVYVYTYGDLEENRNMPHACATQWVASLAWRPRSSTRLSVEAYRKDYDLLPVSEQDIVRETAGDFAFRSDLLLAEAKKTAWGLELFAHQRFTGSWYGTLSYSYGHAEGKDPAYGTHAADYDFRHVALLVFGLRTSLKKKEGYQRLRRTPVLGWFLTTLPINGDDFTISTRYRFISGRPYTRRVWCAEGAPIRDPVWEGHWEKSGVNNERYPDYHRWDVCLDNKHYICRRALVFYVEIENALDRANVADYYHADDGKIDTVHQFRRFIVGGIRFEF
jgi:outer membrane receptor protein involved in Fe transport